MSLSGRRKLAEGREAEIFEWVPGTVLKLFRAGVSGGELEAEALRVIGTAGGPAPRLFDRLEIEGRPGLVIERIDGRDMLAMLERAPYSLIRHAHSLADTQVAIHGIDAPGELLDVKTVLEARIAAAPLASDLQAFAINELDALPDGDRLLHGDFHPGNVLVSGRRVFAIDWPGASRGHPTIDVARTMLLLTLGEPLAPSAWMRALVRVGRGAFARLYLGRYKRHAAVDVTALARAAPAMAAARLTERVPGEDALLTDIVVAARAARNG